MSERKVLNKYYPPDFDPSKIPKLRTPKNRTFSIRIMAPFNMRCNVCGEYIYKGKKFNSRKENVDDEDYLGLRIFRFYIRCPKCVAEIAFKTDLRNTDYTLEAGATRLFEAEKLAQEMAEKERKEKEEEELNPMKVLENRTKASRNEMDQLDELEELREINACHAKVDTDSLIEKQKRYEEHLLRLQQEEEDELVQSILAKKTAGTIKRLADSDSDEESNKSSFKKPTKPTDVLTEEKNETQETLQLPRKEELWKKSVGSFSSKAKMAALVKKKQISKSTESKDSNSSSDHNSTDNSDKNTINTENNKISTAATVPCNSTAAASGSLGLLSAYGEASDGTDSD